MALSIIYFYYVCVCVCVFGVRKEKKLREILSHPCSCVGLIVMACEVFPPGSDDYEAMASLGRMVAQCGPGIEDIVRQRKPQDPSLWYEGRQPMLN